MEYEIPKRSAEFLKDKMKETIIKQTGSSGWHPLSPLTLLMKAPERRMLYDRGKMVEDIKVKIHGKVATVGIHPGAENHDIGVWNEYGTRYIPSRSFIRSTWAKYEKQVTEGIIARFVRRMRGFIGR